MLIEGWRLTPIAAAAAVSVIPACALRPPARPRVPVGRGAGGGRRDPDRGGLAALGLLPDASVVLTFPPQALVGVGLALTLSALTEAALAAARRRRSTAAGRSPRATPGSSRACWC